MKTITAIIAKVLLGGLLCFALHAQPVVTISTASPVYPGAVLNVAATLSGSAGQNIDGIGFTLPAGFSVPSMGPASVAASKTLWNGSANGNQLLIGYTGAPPPAVPVITNVAYGDGALLTFSYTVPATAAIGSPLSLSLTNLSAVNPSGSAVPITIAPLTATVSYAATCLAAINGNVASYLSAPSIALLGQIVAELGSGERRGNVQVGPRRPKRHLSSRVKGVTAAA